MQDLLTWFRLGRPASGPIARQLRNTYPFEEGAEVERRLTEVFGDLSQLSAIDLGAGPGESEIAKRVLDIPWKRLTSVEGFLPYVHRLQSRQPAAAQHEVHNGRIEDVLEDFKPREYDLALMIDVLEHFRRPDALALLRRLESFVTTGIVLFVPLGKVRQEPYDQNALQRHLSFWQPKELARFGYGVHVYEAFHGHLTPPADAAWAIKDLRKRPRRA